MLPSPGPPCTSRLAGNSLIIAFFHFANPSPSCTLVLANHAPCLSCPAILNTLIPVAVSFAPSFTGFPHAFCNASFPWKVGLRACEGVRSAAHLAPFASVRERRDDSHGVPFGGGGTEFATSSAFAKISGRKVWRLSTGTEAKSLGRRHSRALCSSAISRPGRMIRRDYVCGCGGLSRLS